MHTLNTLLKIENRIQEKSITVVRRNKERERDTSTIRICDIVR